jgi:hypothetical protein
MKPPVLPLDNEKVAASLGGDGWLSLWHMALRSFTDASTDGANRDAELLQTRSGVLYGVTRNGGRWFTNSSEVLRKVLRRSTLNRTHC